MTHHREPGTGTKADCGKTIAKGVKVTADWTKVDCPECLALQGSEDWTEAEREAAGMKEETVKTKETVTEGVKLSETKPTKAKVLHYREDGQVKAPCGKPVGLTGIAASLNVPSTTERDKVTCHGCLASLDSKGKTKVKKTPSAKVTIECADCGDEREIYEYQVGIVTRCQECQEAHTKKKLRDKNKARRKAKMKAKKGQLRDLAQVILDDLVERAEWETNNIDATEMLSMIATLIREQYPMTHTKKED